MSLRIGLAVSSDSVRMVAVRDERIVWARESPIGEGVSVGCAVTTLLKTATVPRWPRPRVIAAIGPAQSQVKRLTGLPPVTDARVLARLVQETPGRFFLKNGIPLTMTGVRLAEKGEAWSCALDTPVVQAIAEACLRQNFSLRGVVPTATVLSKSLEDARVVWRDGDVAAELSLRGGLLEEIRRLPMGGEHETGSPVARPELQTLGSEAWRFADAYGAAMTRDDEPVAARPGRAGSYEARRTPRWRLIVAAAATFAAIAAAGFAPGVAAIHRAHAAERTLGALGTRRISAVRVETELHEVSAALAEIDEFQAGRRSPTVFLAQLADALPPTAQLVAVRLDSAGGNLVALAPRAGDAMSRIERMEDIQSPEIVGPVTREFVGQQEKERVTIRFRWRRPTSGSRR